MILNHLPISAYSGVLKFDMKIFVNVARLEIGQLFTQGARRGHPCTVDTFLVFICFNTITSHNSLYNGSVSFICRIFVCDVVH